VVIQGRPVSLSRRSDMRGSPAELSLLSGIRQKPDRWSLPGGACQNSHSVGHMLDQLEGVYARETAALTCASFTRKR